MADKIPDLRLRMTWWGSQHTDPGHRWLRHAVRSAIEEAYNEVEG